MRLLPTVSVCVLLVFIVQTAAQTLRNVALQCRIVPSPGRCPDTEKSRSWSYSTKIGSCTELYGCYGIRDRNVFRTRTNCERSCYITDANDPSAKSYLDCEVNPSPGLCRQSAKNTYYSYSSKTSSCMQINGCYSIRDRNIFLTHVGCRRHCILNRPTGAPLPNIIIPETLPAIKINNTVSTLPAEAGYHVSVECTINPSSGVCLASQKRTFFTFSSKSGSCVQIYGCYSVRDRNVFLTRDSCHSNCIIRDNTNSKKDWRREPQCYINPSPGRCKANERHSLWSFSSKTSDCQQIFGCYSVRDRNAFRTLPSCRRHCVGRGGAVAPPPIDLNIKISLECRINPSPGVCSDREKRTFYSYSSKTGDCDHIYGCYSTRDRNIYPTKAGCRRNCFLSNGSTSSGVMESQCYIVPSQGVCRQEEKRTYFMYTTKTNTCVRIFGCYGIRDRNVFLTRSGCTQSCSGGIPVYPVQPVTPDGSFGNVDVVPLPVNADYTIAPECRINPSPGVCRENQQHHFYTFSTKSSTCVRIYGCYNIRDRNVFIRRDGCRRNCFISGTATPSGVMDSQCYLNPSPGRCRENEKRSYWSYSAKTRSCTSLYGCYSIRDRNVFLRLENCARACTPGVVPETSTLPPVPISDINLECRINPSPGRCREQDRRTYYSYSTKTHRCTEIYGCYSIRDRNVFLTRDHCRQGCFKGERQPGVDSQCAMNPSPGNCAVNQRKSYYSFSSKTSTCVQIYGCYSVRDRNVFITRAGCRKRCIIPDFIKPAVLPPVDINARSTVGGNLVDIRNAGSSNMIDVRHRERTNMVDVRNTGTGSNFGDIRSGGGLTLTDIRKRKTPAMVDVRNAGRTNTSVDIRRSSATNMADIRISKGIPNMVDVRNSETNMVDIREGGIGASRLGHGSTNVIDIRRNEGSNMVDVRNRGASNMIDVRSSTAALANTLGIKRNAGSSMIDMRKVGSSNLVDKGTSGTSNMIDVRGMNSRTSMVDVRNTGAEQTNTKLSDIRSGKSGSTFVDVRGVQTRPTMVDIRGGHTGSNFVDVRGGQTGAGMVDIRGGQTGSRMIDIRGGQTGPNFVDVRRGQTGSGMGDIRRGRSGSGMVHIREGQTSSSLVDVRGGQSGAGMVDIRGGQTGSNLVDIRGRHIGAGMVDIRGGQTGSNLVDIRGGQSGVGMVDIRGGQTSTNNVDIHGGQTGSNMVDIREGQTSSRMVDIHKEQTGSRMADIRGGQTGSRMVDVRGGKTGSNMVDIRGGQTGSRMVAIGGGQTGSRMADIRGGQTGSRMVSIRGGQTGTNKVNIREGQTRTGSTMLDIRRGQTGSSMIDIRNERNMADIRTGSGSATTNTRHNMDPLDPQSLTDLPIINMEPGIRISRECLINPTPGFCLENQRKTFWTFSTKTNSCTRIMGCFDIHDRNTWFTLQGCRKNCFKNDSVVDTSGALPLECQLNPTPGRCLPSDEHAIWVYNTKLAACTLIKGCYDYHDRNVWSSRARCRTKCRVSSSIIAPAMPHNIKGLRIHPECHINPSPGRCRESHQQTFWTFSSKTSACTRITGCYNIRDRNTWRSREECRNSCYVNGTDILFAKPLECKLVPSPGRCLDSQKRSVYTHSEKLGVCVEITGCYDFHDRNVWRTVHACNERCHVNTSIIPDLDLYDVASECQLNPAAGRCQESYKRSFYSFSGKVGGCVEIYGCYTINDRNVWYTRSGCKSGCLLPKAGSSTLPGVAKTCLRPPMPRPCLPNKRRDWYSYDRKTGMCERTRGCYHPGDRNVFVTRRRCVMNCLSSRPEYTIGGIARECRLNPTPGVCREDERRVYWSYSQKTGTCVELTGCYTIRDRNVWITRDMCRNNCIKREVEPRSNVIPDFLFRKSNRINWQRINGIRRGRRGRILTRNMNRNAPRANSVPERIASRNSGSHVTALVGSGSANGGNAGRVTATRDSRGRDAVVSDVVVTKVDTLEVTVHNSDAAIPPPAVGFRGMQVTSANQMPSSRVVASLFQA